MGKVGDVLRAKHTPGLWGPWVVKTDAGITEAFDAETGKLKWSFPYPAQHLLAADGNVYALAQGGVSPKGEPANDEAVVALDLETGKEKWRVDASKFPPPEPPKVKPGEKPPVLPNFQLNTAGQGVLIVSRPKGNALTVLSAADGKVLFEIKGGGGGTNNNFVPIVNGQIWWWGKKLDPKTGQQKGTYNGVGGPGICTPVNVVGDIVTNTRGCAYHVFGMNPAKPDDANGSTSQLAAISLPGSPVAQPDLSIHEWIVPGKGQNSPKSVFGY